MKSDYGVEPHGNEIKADDDPSELKTLRSTFRAHLDLIAVHEATTKPGE
jgi:hypothetical protein